MITTTDTIKDKLPNSNETKKNTSEKPENESSPEKTVKVGIPIQCTIIVPVDLPEGQFVLEPNGEQWNDTPVVADIPFKQLLDFCNRDEKILEAMGALTMEAMKYKVRNQSELDEIQYILKTDFAPDLKI